MIPLKDTVHARSVPFVTVSLILLNLLIFVYESQLGPALEPFVRQWGMVPVEFLAAPGQEWPTLLTSTFLHGGWFHVISNVWALWIFGDNVEDRMGSGKYLLFYLAAGVAAGVAHLLFNPQSALPTVGASGSIAGVLGAYLVLFPRARVIGLVPIFFLFYTIELPAIFYLGIWFLSQIFSGVASLAAGDTMQNMGGVAYWAHAGGFLVGVVVALFFRQPARRQQWPDQYYPF